jgi:hypothetical protein
MAKQGGMGDNFYVDGYNVSGDVGSLARIGGGRAPSEVTGISKSAPERILLQADGAMDYSTWFNDANSAPLGAFQVLKALPTTDRIASYFRGTAVGSPAASLVSKQVNYDLTRPQDGTLTFTANHQANGFGLEWGEQLTAGPLTQTGAGNGSSIDLGAVSTLFGWAAYLHVFAFTGTSITVSVQDSADNSSFTTLTGGSFTAATALGAERLVSSSITATVRRYVRISTAGTFSSATFAVNFVRYLSAQG